MRWRPSKQTFWLAWSSFWGVYCAAVAMRMAAQRELWMTVVLLLAMLVHAYTFMKWWRME